MNSKILMLGSVFVAILLFFTAKNISYNNISNNKTNSISNKLKKHFKIAILTPVTHPSLEQIEKGFCAALSKSENANYDISVFNANGDKILLRAQAEDAINKGADLIFTIGAAACQITKELCTKRCKNIPVVFGAVAHPDSLGLVKSVQNPDGFVTGSVEVADYETQLNLLLQLKPEIKNILLLYNPAQGAGLEKDKNEIMQILFSKNITLSPCEIYNTNEIQAKLAGLIQNIDCVMILKDNTVVSGIDLIIKQCNLHHKILMATDLDSGDKGAALCFGVKESEFGKQSASLATQILEDKINPGKLACITSYKNRLKINTKTMCAQGLNIPESMLNLFKYVKII